MSWSFQEKEQFKERLAVALAGLVMFFFAFVLIRAITVFLAPNK